MFRFYFKKNLIHYRIRKLMMCFLRKGKPKIYFQPKINKQ
ncbi:protein of unknown function [Tenacibaculum jejuense]|uniref:Uncharacterized protein n=1 Tax=Tenacibaculum jejuense TaxID=584609 RepID=A0A238U3S2_9FLAO|nr:protein of unknown function [Tenacibaculum jejuense]